MKINLFALLFGGVIVGLGLLTCGILISFPIQEARDVFELISYIIILCGIPLGLLEFYNNNKKERLEREYGTYDALDREYLEWQKFCFEHPYLDIFDIADASPQKLDPTQEKEELIALCMLYKIFERAYLMYSKQTSAVKKKQWVGWEAYMRDYLDRPNFQKHLHHFIGQYDADFDKFILRIVREKKIPFTLPDWSKYLEK